MLIGKIAKMAGISVDTVRYYELKGLIKVKSIRESGYREFDNNALEDLRFIIRAKKLGFTLKQIKDLLVLRSSTEIECAKVRDLADRKLSEVRKKISDLQQIECQLQKLVTKCEQDSDDTCPIIEDLDKNGIDPKN